MPQRERPIAANSRTLGGDRQVCCPAPLSYLALGIHLPKFHQVDHQILMRIVDWRLVGKTAPLSDTCLWIGFLEFDHLIPLFRVPAMVKCVDQFGVTFNLQQLALPREL